MTVARSRPFRLTPPVTAEDDLHESVADALDLMVLPPAMWTTFPAGNVPLQPGYAAKLARLGLKRGWPDVLVLHERLFGIELKRVGGALSKTRLVRTRGGGLRQLDGQADVCPPGGRGHAHCRLSLGRGGAARARRLGRAAASHLMSTFQTFYERLHLGHVPPRPHAERAEMVQVAP